MHSLLAHAFMARMSENGVDTDEDVDKLFTGNVANLLSLLKYDLCRCVNLDFPINFIKI